MKSSLELLEWGRFAEVLASHCSCDLGREMARRLRPFRQLEALRDAARTVLECRDLVQDGRAPDFGALLDLAELLDQVRRRGTGMNGPELASVLAVLVVAQRCRIRFGGEGPWEGLRARVQKIPDLGPLIAALERTVDRHGEVQDEASPELGALRGRVRSQEAEVREQARRLSESGTYRAVLRDGPPVLRDGRFMLAVKAESRGNVPGVLHDRSASGATVFIEPRELVAPQNSLADLRARERALVRRLLLERSREVLQQEAEILESQQIVGRIDLLFARARFGVRWGARLVEVGEGPLRLREARHPLLLEREAEAVEPAEAIERVVPFDLELGEDFDLVVITGPNTGGKTVTLKTVGLLAVMGACAVPLPVREGSRMPLFDRIEADVGDEQDLQQNLSTFSGHLQRIGAILRDVTPRSLVLLDELGSGTDPKEGEALGDALLRSLLARGCLGVATTHLSALKDLGYELERVENASLEFDAESLQPLYRLTIGLPGESNALRIARRHGLPAEIVDAAERRLERGLGAGARQAAEQVQQSRRLVLEKLEGVEREEKEARERREELQRKIRELEEQAERLEKQKEGEIERVLRGASDEGLALMKKMGSPPADRARAHSELRAFLEGLPERSELTERRRRFIEGLRRDHSVYLPRYRERCVVRKVDRGKELVTVLYRSMSMDVPFREIECPEDFRD